MIIFYSLLIALCFYMECSTKVNTDNIINKIGIACIIVGSFIKIYFIDSPTPHPNNLIAIGVFLHFICEIRFLHKKGKV